MGARAVTIAHRLRVLPLLLVLLLAACSGDASVRRPTPTATPAAIGGGTPADAYLAHLADTGAFRGSALAARGETHTFQVPTGRLASPARTAAPGT